MRSELLTPDITVYPGTPAEVRFEVHNTSEVVDRVDVAIPNADDGWIILPEEDLALFPDTSSEVSLLVNVPESHPAGLYRVTAQLRSSLDHGAVSEHEVTVHVAGATSGELVLRPTMLTGGRRGHLHATLTNTGATELDLVLVATDHAGALEFVLEPHYVVLRAGESADVEITVVGRRSWFANPISHSIDLAAEGSGQQLHAAATFIQKPWIPRGTWTIATLIAIVGLWALIFTVVAQRVTAAGQFGKELPATLLTGQLDLDTTVVSGTAAGVVRAANSGKGLPRVTVEAYRVSAKGNRLAASAASAEDGSYSLGGLLPGRYALKFNAPGFAELWYPAGPTLASGEPVALQAKTTLGGLDIALVGNPGSVSGRLAVADVAGARPLTTMQIRPRDGDVLGRPLTPPTVAPDGSFIAKGLPTPGSYQLTASSTGFVDQKLEVGLAGGEDLVVNTIRLTAGQGSISGTVRSPDGTGLGGVTVKATRGDFSISTITPTGGQIGFFELAGLESPGTYVLSFVLEGYGVQTLALDLGAGQKRTSVQVDLIGGSGTLAGKVIDAQGNPLGGVVVKATSGILPRASQIGPHAWP